MNALIPNYSYPTRDLNGWYQHPLIADNQGHTLWEWEFIVTNGFGIRDNDIRDNDMVGKLMSRNHAFGKKTWSHSWSPEQRLRTTGLFSYYFLVGFIFGVE